MQQALQMVQARVNEARSSLPAESEIQVERLTPAVFPILSLVLNGNVPDADLRDFAIYNLRPLFSRVPGVARIEVDASDVREISVVVDPQKALAHRITLPDLAERLRTTNSVLSVGRLDSGYQQFLILANAQFKNLDEIGNTVVGNDAQSPVRLREIATIEEGIEDRKTLVTGNGQPAAIVNVTRQIGGNIVTVSDEVKALAFHADYYKSLAFLNTSNDADRDDDFPNLRYPKDKSRYAEASQMQQEIMRLLHSVVTSDRELVNKSEWKQLPIEAAGANETPALEQRLPEDEKYLDELRKGKDTPAQKAAAIADQVERIKGVRKRLAVARARGGPAKTFQIRDGEVFANPNTPPQSYYELLATTNLPIITAIRVEIAPINAEKARHTPEDGFVVDRVQATLLKPDGQRERIAFRCFLQDSEENLEAAISSLVEAKKNPKNNKEVADGFSSNPKLFRTRWIVGILAEPLRGTRKTRIEVSLKQTREIDYKPAPIQRVRLALSGEPGWTSLAQDQTRVTAINRLTDLSKNLSKIPAVYVPVMTEEEPYERRTTLEFERGNFLNKIGPDLSPDVPSIFPKFPPNVPRNRLALAQWFFSPGQPLTGRVVVNRYWEQLFGAGIVETLENFGSAGEGPSHPELLDWLALHFQNDLHWDMPADNKRPLSASDVKLIELWISSGASGTLAADAIKDAPSLSSNRAIVAEVTFEEVDPAAVAKQRADVVPVLQQLQQRLPNVVDYQSRSSADVVVNASWMGLKFGDEQLAALLPLSERIVMADLSSTAITDRSADMIAKMKRLRSLRLMHTKITDTTVQALGPLEQLESVSIFDTPVTQAALSSLIHLPKLRRIYAGGTKISAEGPIPREITDKLVF